MEYQHKNLANGKWQEFSLIEQMANIGSEISRAALWQNKVQKIFDSVVLRALELFDLTLCDKRWNGRKKEIARAKEVFCDAVFGGKEYNSSLKNLEKYFFYFAFLVRNKLIMSS